MYAASVLNHGGKYERYKFKFKFVCFLVAVDTAIYTKRDAHQNHSFSVAHHCTCQLDSSAICGCRANCVCCLYINLRRSNTRGIFTRLRRCLCTSTSGSDSMTGTETEEKRAVRIELLKKLKWSLKNLKADISESELYVYSVWYLKNFLETSKLTKQ